MKAPWPASGVDTAKRHGPPPVDEEARKFWAFRPVVRPAIPSVKDREWCKNPIDAFLYAKLEAANLKPAPPTDKVTLLRRVYFAVIGLPPSPAEVDAFLEDKSPIAYEKVVDHLLASRHYGEHWGRHWLDLVRYAETNSFERDGAKPFVWRYRDYVIRAFNDDKPYDHFLKEQLAGDELDDVTPDGLIATGYYRLGTWDDEPANPLLAYYDELDDIAATTGQVFLGLTVNCARCHDHKIDPFPQKDYYQLLAFFHGIRHFDNGAGSLRSIAGEEDRRKHHDQIAAYDKKLADLKAKMAAIEDSLKPHLRGGERDDFNHEVNRPKIIRKYTPKVVSEENGTRYEALLKEYSGLRIKPPPGGALALCVTEEGSQVKDTFILMRGNPLSHGNKVEPGFPSVLSPPDAPALTIAVPNKEPKTPGRRRVLADWLANPQNPLTARVMVNRVWQYHFGRGLVRSSNNFGYQGTPPTHPELLDWLAGEFVRGGYRLKPLHRLILTSRAFRMAGDADPSALAKDPENDLLQHFDLRRLTAEEVRDSILAVCGNLNLAKTEGPSVYPIIPKEVLAGQSMPGNGWGQSTPEEAASRSVFIHVKRTLPIPLLAAFDGADLDATCPVRFTTTQPTQALALLNSEFVNGQAKLFAENLRKEAGEDVTDQVRLALRRVTQRAPTEKEIERGIRFITDTREKDKLSEEEALRRFCLLALNLNEFVFLN
jgi:hypothetical protein